MKDKILSLLNKRDFVSGEQLARHLGVSRTAVWKQITILKNLGYEIESIKNKGYKLISRPDILIPEEIKNGLDSNIIGNEIHYFKKQRYIAELIRIQSPGSAHGTGKE